MSIYNYVQDGNMTNLPLSTSLFSSIRKDILRGEIKPGEKLTEQKICQKYKVSRTPVREALRQLEMDGLIENKPNRGAFVIGFSRQDLLDMYDLRKTYEMQAVKWAIERITDEELDSLEETFEFMEFYTMKNDIDKMLNINTNFHKKIYEASHNRMLEQLLSSYQIYVKYTNVSEANLDENYLPTVLEEHRKIFEAFIHKDPEEGARYMAIHMDNSKTRRMSHMKDLNK